MISRRLFTAMLLATLAVPAPHKAWAKDDDGGGGDGGGRGGDGGGRGGDDGGDGGGHGGDDGGHGGDDGGKDDGGGDGSKGDSRGGSDDSKESGSDSDSDDNRIRRAVRDGKAQPLKTILKKIRARFQAQVVRVRLTRRGNALMYRIRMIDRENRLIDVPVEAASGDVVTPNGIY